MQPFELITTQEGINNFSTLNQEIDWMCFDTEFVGEKRFQTRLCLIQVATKNGFFLLDPFTIEDLSPFLTMLQDPSIIKVTHAGENDYRLLFNLYSILPVNTFDTQIAAGFLGYRYPLAFKKLVETELRFNLKKSYTVADWEARPFNKNQLQYALSDIEPLHDLWKIQEADLLAKNRLHWAQEEFAQLCNPLNYGKDPNMEALNSEMMKSLNKREQVFLLRLFEWRRKVAEEKNYSKEMVLPSKLMGQIVRSIRSGREALADNRRIPPKFATELWGVMNDLYSRPITDEERNLLSLLPTEEDENPQEDVLSELLYLVIKYHCMNHGVSNNLAFPRNWFKKIKADPAFAEDLFDKSWRKELFGSTFTIWLQHPERLSMTIEDNLIALRLANGDEELGQPLN